MSEASAIEMGVVINVDSSQIDVADDKLTSFVDKTKTSFSEIHRLMGDNVTPESTILQGTISDSLEQAKTALSSLPTFMTTLTSEMRRSIVPLVSELTGAMQKVSKMSSDISTLDAHNKAASATMQIIDRANRLSNLMNNMQTLPDFAKGNNATSFRNLVSSAADVIAKEQRMSFTPTTMAEQLSQHKLFRQGVSKITGIDESALDRKQLEDVAKYYMNLNGPRSYIAGPSRSKSDNFMKQNVQFSAIEDVSAKFRDLFKARGVNANITRSNKTFDHRLLQDLTNLVYGGNSEALQLAQRVGLARMVNGEVEWRRKATTDQVNSLTGWWARRLSDAKAGSPLYEHDPYSSWRINNQVAELLEVQDILSKYSDNINGGIIDNLPMRWSKQKGTTIAAGAARAVGPVKNLRSTVQYVIPQTAFDENGRLIYRDPSTANKNGVLEERDTDPFITFNESQLSRLLGFNPFTEANTYGYGRGDDGRSIYGMPKVIKISNKNAFNYNEEGFIKNGREALGPTAKYFEQLIGGKEVEYGEEGNKRKYSFAYITNDGVYAIDSEYKKRIESDAKSRGLSHIFEGFNANGFIVPGDEKATNKQLSNARKMATPQIQLREFGYNKGQKDPYLGIVDLESLYDTWNLMFPDAAKNGGYFNKIDGSILLDPSQTPTSFQGRAAIDALKFMAQRYNWRAELGRFITDDMINGSNQLVTRAKSGFSLWLPSMTMPNEFEGLFDSSGKALDKMSKSDVIKAMINGGLSEGDASRIRKQYMTDVMNSKYGGIMFDSSIKNIDKFREMTVEDYKTMFKGQASQAKIDAAMKAGTLVRLNKAEAEKYMHEAIDYTGGIGMVRPNDEFETQKNIMSRSQAQALNLPPSVFRKQAEVFEKRYRQLNDIEYVRQHGLTGNRYFNRKIKEDPNWIYQGQARSIIQSEIKGLETAKDRGSIFLENDSYSALAQPLAGSTFAVLQELFGKTGPNDIQNSSLFDWNRFLSEEQKAYVDKGAKIMYAPDYMPDASGRVIGGRTPASPGTYREFVNIAYKKNNEGKYVLNNDLVSQMDELGYDRHVIALNPEDIQYMNTGDFDGDTIWLYAGLGDEAYKRLSFTNQKMLEARQRSRDRETVKVGKKVDLYDPKVRQEGNLGQAGVENMYHRIRSQLVMGRGAGAIRNAMANYSDDDYRKWMALVELNDYYDLATSEVLNEGLAVDFADKSFAKDIGATTGRQWDRFTKLVGDERVRSRDQEPYHGNIFKHYLANLYSATDLGQILLNSTSVKNGLGDGGFRENLSTWLNEVYGTEGATAEAARWFGDVLSGQYFLDNLISQKDFRLQGRQHINAMRSELATLASNPAVPGQKIQQVKDAVESFERMFGDFSKDEGASWLFSDTLGNLANTNPGSDNYLIGRVALAQQLFENYNAGKSNADVGMAFRNYIEQRQAEERAIKEAQDRIAKNNNISLHEAVNTKIQDTSDLENFNTQYSFTQVEPWMRANERSARLFSMPVTRRNLRTGAYQDNGSVQHVFGSEDAIRNREALELLNQTENSADIVLGLLMHSGFEQTLEEMAKNGLVDRKILEHPGEVVKGSHTSAQKRDGKLVQVFEPVADYEMPPVYQTHKAHNYEHGTYNRMLMNILDTYKEDFRNAGIDIEDIKQGLTPNAEGKYEFGESVKSIGRTRGSYAFENKLRELFGVDLDASGPELLMRHLFGEGTANKIVQSEDRIYMPDGKGGYNIQKLGGDSLDAVKLPNVIGLKKNLLTHAKPDLVYEDMNGVFHMVDYKSSEGWQDAYGSSGGGSEQSLYQQMVYANMLSNLSKRAYETKDEEEAKILNPYKRYGYMKDGMFHSRFEGGTATGWSLDKSGLLTVNLDEKDEQGRYLRDLAEDEFYEAVKNKQRDLAAGYVLGKMKLSRDGLLQKSEQEEIEKTKDLARKRIEKTNNATEGERELLTKETKYLIDKYASDVEKLDELGSQIGKEARQYRSVGRTPYNRFAQIRESLDNTLTQETLAAMYSEYLPREAMDDASKIAVGDVSNEQIMRQRYEDMLSRVVYMAAGEDLARGKTALRQIIGGYERSDIESQIGKINAIVNEKIGSREELKNVKTSDGQKIWDEKRAQKEASEWLSLHPNDRLTEEISAGFGWLTDATQSDVSSMATNYKQRYIDTIADKNELESLREKAIGNVYTKHAADMRSSLMDILPKDDFTLEEAIQNKYNDKINNVKTLVLKYQEELEQLEAKFKDKDAQGHYTVNGSERDSLEAAIKGYKDVLGKITDKDGNVRTDLFNKMRDSDIERAKGDRLAQEAKMESKLGRPQFNLSYAAQKAKDYADFKEMQTSLKNLPLSEFMRNPLAVRYAGMSEEDWQKQYDQNQFGMLGLSKRDAIAQQARLTWRDKQDQIKALKNAYSGDELSKHIAGFIPFLSGTEEDYVNGMLGMYDDQQQISAMKLENQLYTTRLRNMTPRHAFTRLGRQVNAKFAKIANAEAAYLTAGANVADIQNQYANAMQMGDIEKAAKLSASLQIAKMQQENTRYAGGILGGISNNLFSDRILRANKILGVNKELETLKAFKNTDKYANMDQGAKDAHDKLIESKQGEVNSMLKEGGFSSIKDVANDLNSATAASTAFKTVMAGVGGTMSSVTQTVRRFSAQFGRRIFYSAIREATQFVKQYDTTMKQIQAITLKSDSEMQGIRAESIDQAIRLKTTTTNVAQVKSDLYRQGLQDSEVNTRSEAIIKFATVTGAKVTAATKIITTALQNDLVSSAQEAMDVLTALGDSAATTAEEIGKGMQKSAAAAKVAGVSYEELASMLTIITSKTQLGGTQAGTALQTIFNRMHRVSANSLATDETGEAVSINDVEKSLKVAGVALRKENGDFRDTTEVLRDLAKVWNELNDVQKNAVMYSMAGGRQSNMFAQLMEGFAEDGGAELDRLLGLAEGSEGITQTKYEIAVSGINGQLNELKQTWDSLVASFVETGNLQNILQTITSIAGVLGNIIQNMGAGNALLSTMITLTGLAIAKDAAWLAIKAGLAASDAATKGDGYTAAVRAAAVGAAIVGTVAAVSGQAALLVNSAKAEPNSMQETQRRAKEEQTASIQFKEKQYDQYTTRIDKTEKALSYVQEYFDKYGNAMTKEASDAENLQLEKALNNISYSQDNVAVQFDNLQGVIQQTQASLKDLKATAKKIQIEKMLEEIIANGQTTGSDVVAFKNYVDQGSTGSIAQIVLDENGQFSGNTYGYVNNQRAVRTQNGAYYLLDEDSQMFISTTDAMAKSIDESGLFRAASAGSNYQLPARAMAVLYNSQFMGNNQHIDEQTISKLEREGVVAFDVIPNILAATGMGIEGIAADYAGSEYVNQQLISWRRSSDIINGDYNKLTSTSPLLALLATVYGDTGTLTGGQKQLVESWLSYSGTQSAINKYYEEHNTPNTIRVQEGSGNLLSTLMQAAYDEDKTEDERNAAIEMLGWMTNLFVSDMQEPESVRGQENIDWNTVDGFYAYMMRRQSNNLLVDTLLSQGQSVYDSVKDRLYEAQIDKTLRQKMLNALEEGRDVTDSVVLSELVGEILRNPYEGLNENDFDYQLRYGDKTYGFFENTEESLMEALQEKYNMSPEEAKQVVKRFYNGQNGWQNIYKKNALTGEFEKEHKTVQQQIEQFEDTRTQKDRGYMEESLMLLQLIDQSKGSSDVLLNLMESSGQFANLQAYMKAAGLEDVFIDFNKQGGQYSVDYLRSEIYKKIFGGSYEENIGKYKQSASEIDQMQYLAGRLQDANAVLNADEIQEVAKAIGRSSYWVQTNRQEAASTYQRDVINKQQAELQQSVTSDIYKMLGETLTPSRKRMLDEDEVEKLLSDNVVENVELFDSIQEAIDAGFDEDQIKEYMNGQYIVSQPVISGEDLELSPPTGYGFENGQWYKIEPTFEKFQDLYDSLSEENKRYIDEQRANGFEFGIGESGQVTISRNGKTVDFDEYANVRNFDTVRTNQEKAALSKKALDLIGKWGINYSTGQAFKISSLDDIIKSGEISSQDLEYIKQNDNDTYRWLTMSEEQRESAEGRALKQNMDISISVAGIQDLEELGEVAEGTASMIERLMKNGTIKISAEVELMSKNMAMGQSIQDLYGGDQQQQIEAIASILGIDKSQVMSDFSGYKRLAEQMSQQRISENGNMWIELYKAQTTPEGKKLILDMAKKNGYTINSKVETNENSAILSAGEDVNIIYTADYNPNDVAITNPLATGEKVYTAKDIRNAFIGYNATNWGPGLGEGQIATNKNMLEAIAASGYSHIAALENLRQQMNAATNPKDKELARRKLDQYYKENQNEIVNELVQSRLAEPVATGKVGADIAGVYQSIYNDDWATRQSAFRSMYSTITNASSAQYIMSQLEQNAGNNQWWATRGEQMVDELGSMLGWDDEVKKRFKDPQRVNEMKKAVDEYIGQLDSQISEQFKAITGKDLSEFNSLQDAIDALATSGDEAAPKLMELIKYLQQLGVTIDEGLLRTEPEDFRDISQSEALYTAGVTSGYYSEQQKKDIRNKIAQAAATNPDITMGDLLEIAGVSQIDEFNTKMKNSDTELMGVLARFGVMPEELPNKPDQSQYDMQTQAGIDAYNAAYEEWSRLNRAQSVKFKEGFSEAVYGLSDYEAAAYDNTYLNGYERAKEAGLFSGGVSLADIESFLTDEQNGGVFAEENQQFVQGFETWENLTKAIEDNRGAVDETNEAYKDFVNEGLNKSLVASKAFGKNSQTVADYMKDIKGDAKTSANALKSFNSALKSASENQYARQKYRQGARDSKTIESIMEQTGLQKSIVENGGKVVEDLLDQIEAGEQQQIQEWADGFTTQLSDDIVSNMNLTVDGITLNVTDPKVNMESAEWQQLIAQQLDDFQKEAIAILEAFNIAYHLEVTDNQARIVIDSMGSGGSGGGGGGGGGKSDVQKLIERLKREKELSDHRLKMLQYAQSYYEARGEYGNMIDLLGDEEDLRYKMIEDYQAKLQEIAAKLSETTKETDDWYNLRSAYLEYEENIEDCINAIDELQRKEREYRKSAIQTRTSLEEDLEEQINNRIQRERDMLDGTVSMQDTILEAIRERYREEWEIVRKDIEKKRQALEEEKSMIEERLNKRKEAEDEALKYEEIAELQRQYAMISMDATRSKDAAELRQKIADAQREQYWKQAEDEVKAQQEERDDQIKALDQFEQNGDEDLEAYLENANNFADEVNSILGGHQEELFAWLKANIKDYANSLQKAQEQMLNSWTDTYKQMMGITDKYWDQINAILMSKEDYLNYKMESYDYQIASDAQKQLMQLQWEEDYDNYRSAQLSGATWSHEDPFYNVGKEKSTSGSTPPKKYTWQVTGTTSDGEKITSEVQADTESGAKQVFKSKNKGKNFVSITATIKSTNSTVGNNIGNTIASGFNQEYGYSQGGLVDYTGQAMVHGTPLRPEAFLDADDTQLMRDMLDSMKYVKVHSTFSDIDSASFFGGGGMSIGNLDITITEAQFKEDADYEKVAERVGEAFVKELNKQGFMTTNYSF